MLKPRINIFDTDQTTVSGAAEQAFDVAFVPGFTTQYAGDEINTYAPDPVYPEFEYSDSPIVDGAPQNDCFWYDTRNKKQYKYQIEESEDTRYEPVYQARAYTYSADVPVGYRWTGNPESSSYWEYLPSNGSPILYYVAGSNVVVYSRSRLNKIDVTTVYDSGDPTYPCYEEIDTTTIRYYAESHDEYEDYIISPEITDTKVAMYHSFSGVAGYQLFTLKVDVLTSNAAEYSNTISDTYRGYMYQNNNDGSTDPQIDTSFSIYEDAVVPKLYKYTYIEQSTYTEPAPETLSLCNSLNDFYAKFGSTPVVIWEDSDGNYHFNKENTDKKIVWVDRNWLYAAELLRNGLPVYYYAQTLENITPDSEGNFDQQFRNVYFGNKAELFKEVYRELADKGEYDVKYITTGVFGLNIDTDTISINISEDSDELKNFEFYYPFYDTPSAPSVDPRTRNATCYLIDIANYRKDVIDLIDSVENYDQSFLKEDTDSVYYKLNQLVTEDAFVNVYDAKATAASDDEKAKSGRRGTNILPWYKATLSTFPSQWVQYRTDKNVFVMPGSFAYLTSLARAITNYESASYKAVAGVTRGIVPNFVGLYTDKRWTNAVADAYNPSNGTSLNVITNVRPYGYAIWGNRTLVNNEYFATQGDGENGLVASSFVDIMSMVCNVNKVGNRTAKRLMFEKNNDILWIRFMQGVTPYLDTLASGGAIRTYTIERIDTDIRGKLIARITIYPIYSLESVDVEILLRDEESVES